MKFHKAYLEYRCSKLDNLSRVLGELHFVDDQLDMSVEEYMLVKLLLNVDLLFFDGNYYSSEGVNDKLPEGLVINCTLDCSTHSGAITLPNNLTIGGNLFLPDEQTELPSYLTIGTSLHLGNTLITKLPETLSVGSHITTRPAQLTYIPRSLESKIWAYPHYRANGQLKN